MILWALHIILLTTITDELKEFGFLGSPDKMAELLHCSLCLEIRGSISQCKIQRLLQGSTFSVVNLKESDHFPFYLIILRHQR